MALQPVARLGDTASGTCTASSHSGSRSWTGTFTTATAGHTADGLPVVRIGDTGVTDCGHTFIAVAGSTVFTGVDGIPVVRVGDAVNVIQGGSGVVTGGSPNYRSE